MMKKGGKQEVTNEKIMGFLVEMDERMISMDERISDINERMATKEDLKNFATIGDLERVKEEIIEPIIKAVDKDAEMVVSHEKRIIVLERKVGVTTK